MLLRKSFVATAVLGAASEWRAHMGSTTASARHAPTTERSILEKVIVRRDFIERLRLQYTHDSPCHENTHAVYSTCWMTASSREPRPATCRLNSRRGSNW